MSKRSSPDPGGARRGRSLSDLMLTLRELQELDVAFVSLTEAFDLTTSTGRAMAAMVAVFAEFEREIRSERVRAGIEQSRHEGRQHGRPRSASLRQGRRHFARVIDTDERIWKVPESVLKHSGGARRAMVITRHDKARADYRMGDEVTFTSPDGLRCGEIVKLNPKTAKVRHEETSWNVSYGLLRRSGGENVRNGAERLNSVAGMARRLMDEHGLTGWTLAFVEAKGRLGDCHFRNCVIRISRNHALEGSEEQIRDTVLHEIAHAIAGREAGHGPLWKITARRIGATPRAKAYESQER